MLAATVVKTSDADGNGTFTNDEIAKNPGAPLPYRAVITNTSPVAVVLTTLTDSIPNQPLIDICPNLVGTVLQPAQSVTCDFQRPAPAIGPAVVDTVSATMAEVDHPDNTVTVTGTARVVTVHVLPTVVTRPPKMIPFTGKNALRTVFVALAAIVLGLLLVVASGLPRRRQLAEIIRHLRD